MASDTAVFRLLVGPEVPVRAYKAGETIFEQGDPAREFYVIQSGTVEVWSGNRLLNTCGPDEIFGEMALVDSSPRSAAVRAATDLIVVPISEKQFLFLVSNTPYFALNVMRTMAARLRSLEMVI